jgi:hypothetical protein
MLIQMEQYEVIAIIIIDTMEAHLLDQILAIDMIIGQIA